MQKIVRHVRALSRVSSFLCRMKGCRNCYYQRDRDINLDKRQVYGKRSFADGIHAARVMEQLRLNSNRLSDTMTHSEKQQLWTYSLRLAQSVADMLVNVLVCLKSLARIPMSVLRLLPELPPQPQNISAASIRKLEIKVEQYSAVFATGEDPFRIFWLRAGVEPDAFPVDYLHGLQVHFKTTVYLCVVVGSYEISAHVHSHSSKFLLLIVCINCKFSSYNKLRQRSNVHIHGLLY
jgi:hypothetical protein